MTVSGIWLSIISTGMLLLLCIPLAKALTPSLAGCAPEPPISISTSTSRRASSATVWKVQT